MQAKSVTPAEVGCLLGTWAAVLAQCNQSTGDCQQCGSDGRGKPVAGTGINTGGRARRTARRRLQPTGRGVINKQSEVEQPASQQAAHRSRYLNVPQQLQVQSWLGRAAAASACTDIHTPRCIVTGRCYTCECPRSGAPVHQL